MIALSRHILALALLSLGLALLLMPAFAIASGTDVFAWPPSAKAALPILAGTWFVVLGLADLFTGLLRCAE